MLFNSSRINAASTSSHYFSIYRELLMFVSRSAVPKVAIDVETLKEAGADNESKVNQNVSTPTVNKHLEVRGDGSPVARHKTTAILPSQTWYQWFWYLVVFTAFLTGIIEPLKMAFFNAEYFGPNTVFWTIAECLGTLIFFVDIVLKFYLAYQDPVTKDMVTDLGAIRWHYIKTMFFPDVLFMFPWAAVILTATPSLYWIPATGNQTAVVPSLNYSLSAPSPPNSIISLAVPLDVPNVVLYVSILGLLKLGRLYNTFEFFTRLDKSMVVNIVLLTIIRNTLYIVVSCHWFACAFYFTARVESYSPVGSWVGRSYHRFADEPVGVSYLYSFYLAVITFVGLGDSDFYCNSPTESLIMSIFLMYCIILSAFILGTVTLLMVKGDKRSKVYRDRMMMLNEFSQSQGIPEDLSDAMRQHLNLHYTREHTSDAKVLAIYPTAITRRVLRHLYLEPITGCYLFQGCKRKFLDILIPSCHVEMFMPNVQLISLGDIVSDLYMVISGEVVITNVESRGADASAHRRNSSSSSRQSSREHRDESSVRSGSNDSSSHTQDPSGSRRGSVDLYSSMHSASSGSMGASGHLRGDGHREMRGPQQCFGEVAFFTDSPSSESVWTDSLVTVLVVPRKAYDMLSQTFSSQMRRMLINLRTEYGTKLYPELNSVLEFLPSSDPADLKSRLKPFMRNGVLETIDLPAAELEELKLLLTPFQNSQLEQMQIISASIASFFAKMEQQHIIELLDAASKGNEKLLVKLLKQGLSASCSDYDKRTACMVASQEGREEILRILIKHKANIHALDLFGTNALVGAVRFGHSGCVDILRASGASLFDCTETIKTDVIQSIVDQDMETLTTYISAGADPNMADYRGSTLLHVASGLGNLEAVQLLVEAGADIFIDDKTQDAWGSKAIDDARTMGHPHVVEFLKPLMDKGPTVKASTKSAADTNAQWPGFSGS